MFKKETFSMKG